MAELMEQVVAQLQEKMRVQLKMMITVIGSPQGAASHLRFA